MSTEENVQTVKNFFAAVSRGDGESLFSLISEEIEWIMPGHDWPLAGTYRGHAGVADAFQKSAEEMEFSYPQPPEYVAQGDRVLAIGFARGKMKATNKEFEDHFVFDILVRDGKLARIREYIDTQALARAASGPD